MSLPLHRFGHEAMATHFQLLFYHEDELIANGIAREIFADIDRLEQELSRFVRYSDISCINRAAVSERVQIQAACMDCLSYGKLIWEATQGAFDVTIGPLFRILREMDAPGERPSRASLAAARASVGFQHLILDSDTLTVTKQVEGMSLDLGAIGKGYALDQALLNLQQLDITNALLNAGDSTVLAMGNMAEQDGWPVRAGQGEPVHLRNQALSGTGFMHQGAHILNPRTGKLVTTDRMLRWAIAPNATLADALSTAFMVMNRKEIEAFCQQQPETKVIFYR
jgi:FAD:protein FMN transferase